MEDTAIAQDKISTQHSDTNWHAYLISSANIITQSTINEG